MGIVLCAVYDFRQMSHGPGSLPERMSSLQATSSATEKTAHCLKQISAKQNTLKNNKTLHTRYYLKLDLIKPVFGINIKGRVQVVMTTIDTAFIGLCCRSSSHWIFTF